MQCVRCDRERDGKKRCDFCLKEQKKLYRQNNKEKIAVGNKVYYENNKLKIRKQKNVYDNNKFKNDPTFRLRKRVSNSVFTAIQRNGASKQGSILKFLPYTIQKLKEHLEKQFEPWMTWNNYGIAIPDKRTWQIDHIVPQSKLLYISMEDENFKKCWALDNLRPLETFENIKKANK